MNVGENCFREDVIKPRSKYQNVVGIVNLAFACELFIKCSLNNMGKAPSKGHELEKLWSDYRNAYAAGAAEIEMAVMEQLESDRSFEGMLQDISDTFCNLRYFYERDNTNGECEKPIRPQFLRVLTRELKETSHGKLYIENDKRNR